MLSLTYSFQILLFLLYIDFLRNYARIKKVVAQSKEAEAARIEVGDSDVSKSRDCSAPSSAATAHSPRISEQSGVVSTGLLKMPLYSDDLTPSSSYSIDELRRHRLRKYANQNMFTNGVTVVSEKKPSQVTGRVPLVNQRFVPVDFVPISLVEGAREKVPRSALFQTIQFWERFQILFKSKQTSAQVLNLFREVGTLGMYDEEPPSKSSSEKWTRKRLEQVNEDEKAGFIFVSDLPMILQRLGIHISVDWLNDQLAQFQAQFDQMMVSCDSCGQMNLQEEQFFHHCGQCKYDLCSKCDQVMPLIRIPHGIV
jgi:hypothetical protein